MDMLKFAKHGINLSSISTATQLAEINDAIEAEEAKIRKEKQAQRQLDEQRHKENIKLQQKSLDLAEKSMKLAEVANKKSNLSNWIAFASMIIAFASALIALFK